MKEAQERVAITVDSEDPKPDRVISKAEFRKLLGIGKTTEYNMGREGRLPEQLIIGGRKLGYLESSYYKWLRENSK